MKQFTGAWATFRNRQDLESTVDALVSNGLFNLTVHSPYPLKLPADLSDKRRPPLNVIAFIGGLIGLASALFFIVSANLDWLLPLSGKPIISILTMIPIAFEVSIFMAVCFALGAMVVYLQMDRKNRSLPTSTAYQQYNRFSRDRFGIVVCCDHREFKTVKQLFLTHQAEEIYLEG